MYNKILNKIMIALIVLSLGGIFTVSKLLFADDESTTNQIKDKAGDVKTETKKAVRKAKRKARNATGHGSVTKDMKDKANDIGDDISNDADKAKRRLNN